MYGHPRAYWADPEEERDKRIYYFLAGLVVGAVAGVIAFSVWIA
jgi:hypothetical protein